MIKTSDQHLNQTSLFKRCVFGCLSAVQRTAMTVSKLGIGAGVGFLAGQHVQNVFIQTAEKMGLLTSKFSDPIWIFTGKILQAKSKILQARLLISYLAKVGIRINALKVASARCPITNIAHQINAQIPLSITPDVLKISALVFSSIVSPVISEVTFRGVIQSICVKPLSRFVTRSRRGNYSLAKNVAEKVLTVLLSATIYSATNLLFNRDGYPDSYIRGQFVSSFALGVLLGAVKETPAGLSGSIGAHGLLNAIAIAPQLARLC
jgi:hypothetical protein